jgi:NAD(P)-dependent dehydrogenase (short-subunit alcohol dehydrogenase family)
MQTSYCNINTGTVAGVNLIAQAIRSVAASAMHLRAGDTDQHAPEISPSGSISVRRACTHEAARVMIAQRSGAIVCMSSGAREGTPWTAYHVGGAAYSAAKSGIHGFIRDAALELAEFEIRINAVAPGPIETERTVKSFEELRKTSEFCPRKLVPMRQISQPRQIADANLCFASDEASYNTGTTSPVAGGR